MRARKVKAPRDNELIEEAGDGPKPRLTDAEKAQRHRMMVKRSYYQKKELKARLRDEIATLEAQYQQLVGETTQLQLAHTEHSQTPSDNTIGGLAAPHCGTCAQLELLRRQYRELSVAKEALQKEREALEDSIHDRLIFNDKAELLVQRELARLDSYQKVESLSTSGAALPPLVASLDDDTITIHTDEFHVCFEPLTEPECDAIIYAALANVKSQSSSPDDFYDVAPHLIMGWNRKRSFGSPPTNFSLLKSFTMQSAATLWKRTWRLYTETRQFEQLYSGTVNMKFHILQRINDRTVLFARTLKTEQLNVRNLTFFLLACVQIENKHYILFRSIDKQRLNAADHPDEAVVTMFSWMCFTDRNADLPTTNAGDGFVSRCDLEFAGVLPSASVADASFWMMELVSVLLRLETRVIGPVFQVLH